MNELTARAPASGAWEIETTATDDVIDELIREFTPWRVLIRFNGHLSTDTYGTREPFNRTPLLKMKAIEAALPEEAFRGTALDIGFNCGYNAIHLASRGMKVVGIENNPNNLRVALRLAELARGDVSLSMGDAEDYLAPDSLDLALHLGTLYHLKNPVRSLENIGRSVRSGGWIALETVAYVGGTDGNECLWVYGFAGDMSNTWAIGKSALESMLRISGFCDPKLVIESYPAAYNGKMSRVLYVAQKS